MSVLELLAAGVVLTLVVLFVLMLFGVFDNPDIRL